MTLNVLRNQLSKFHPASIVFADFKSDLELYINAETQPGNPERIWALKDNLTVEMRCQKILLTDPSSFLHILSDYLGLIGLQYVPYPETRQLIKAAANYFFGDEKEKAYAVQCIDRLSLSSPVGMDRSSHIIVSSSPVKKEAFETDPKTAHNMAQRFRKRDWFSAKLGEDTEEYISSYEEAGDDYELSLNQKYEYFPILCDEEAKRFFCDDVLKQCENYRDAKVEIIK